MPDERMIHPAEGESEKLTKLTDFEHRVWVQYKLSADDFGVMTESPALLRGANFRLNRETDRTVQRALNRIVELEILHRFTHQGRPYVYSRNWQDWQHVKYPRTTHLPHPPQEEIDACTDDTKALFSQRVSGRNGAGNVNEKEIEQRLSERFKAIFGDTADVQTQVRLGNSYCDMVITPKIGPILAVEIKKHPLTPAALIQTQKYAESLSQQWPDREVSPVVVGRGLGRLDEQTIETAGAAAITFDQHLNLTVIDHTIHKSATVIAQLNDREITHARGGARNANALANANASEGEPERGVRPSPPAEHPPGFLQLVTNELVAEWNARVRPPLKAVDNPEPSRGKILTAVRLRPSMEEWREVFDRAFASEYLMGRVPGRDGTTFRLTLWWLLEGDHADKVLGGTYENRKRVDTAGSPVNIETVKAQSRARLASLDDKGAA